MIDPDHIKSQKLVKCLLQSKDDRTSTRFIELENYKLWSYMITHKHGFRIREIFLALWMNEEEFAARRDLTARYGKVIRLNRIVITVYDDANGFSLAMSRYVLDHETAMMKEVLSSHVRQELKASNSFEMRIVRGYGIVNQKKLDKAVLGLSSDQIY